PCPMCLGAIYWARPKKLVFAANKFDAANAGFDDSLIYDEIHLPYSDRHLETVNLRVDESLQPFELWMSESNKRTY
ncbi:MAG: hypothetical protein WBL76_07165, partial [Bacteroidales bacterium]